MFDALLISLKEIATLDAGLALFIGSIFGLICGILPGLSGLAALVLLMPATFFMEPSVAIVTLTSAMGAATVGGAVTSILIGVPGAGYSAATVFDGYPLAQQGRAAFALGIASFSSMVGGILGALTLLIALPVMRQLLFIVGPPEVLIITIYGVLIISLLVGRSILNGFIAVSIGFMLSLVGFNPVLGGVRYTFNILHLWDGLAVGPVFIGLFAISEAIVVSMKGKPIASTKVEMKEAVKQIYESIGWCIKNTFLMIKCSIIGVFIGIVPGVGGPVASYVAYGYAKSTSKNGNFGNGDPRGVLAPESSNNGVQGGSMVPTLSFGIPGSASAAVLLGALMIHGIQPGPSMLTENLPAAMLIINIIILSNIVGSLIVCLLGGQLAKITNLHPGYLVPIVVTLSLFGAYSFKGSYIDVIVAIIIGFAAYYLRKYNVSIAAISIGYILGIILERNFFIALQMGRGSINYIIYRPFSMVLLLITIITFVLPLIKGFKKNKYKEA